ncbi:hypothetical protein LIER_02865 [Lithospermum erythrorhizon]|uniref:Uncharacterized protein n=1 Tax=Lithospermum erythrorhizon TaxID=34254 RepID=A0AAV3NR45_LITER
MNMLRRNRVMVGGVILVFFFNGIKKINGGVSILFCVGECSNMGVIEGGVIVSEDILVLVLIVVMDMFQIVKQGTFRGMSAVEDGVSNPTKVVARPKYILISEGDPDNGVLKSPNVGTSKERGREGDSNTNSYKMKSLCCWGIPVEDHNFSSHSCQSSHISLREILPRDPMELNPEVGVGNFKILEDKIGRPVL